MLSSCNCSNTIIFSFSVNKLLLKHTQLKQKQKQKQKQRQTVLVAASIHHDSLRVLEWDKLSDLVSSFATTSLGRHALKVSLSLKSIITLVLLLYIHNMLELVFISVFFGFWRNSYTLRLCLRVWRGREGNAWQKRKE